MDQHARNRSEETAVKLPEAVSEVTGPFQLVCICLCLLTHASMFEECTGSTMTFFIHPLSIGV